MSSHQLLSGSEHWFATIHFFTNNTRTGLTWLYFFVFLVCAEFRAPLNLKEPVQVGEWAAHEQIVTTFDLH